MSAYNIQLPGVVLAGLYKKSVLQGEGKAVESGGPAIPPQPEVKQPVEKAPVAPVTATAPVATAAPVAPIAPVAQIEEKAPVAPPVAPVVAPRQPAGTALYKFLGKNQQHVTIIVRFPGEAFLPEQHLQMLSKMLGACKLNLGDVAIVNDANQGVDINQLKEQLYPKRVLLFGIAPDAAGLPLSFPMFKDQEYAGTTYLYTPPLEELNQDTEEGKLLKRKLWESLKKIFNV